MAQPSGPLPPPTAPLPPPDSGLPELHDIAPPVDVFPYPPWMVALVIAVAVILFGLLVWWLVRRLGQRPATPPLSPRAAALRDLEALRVEVDRMDPYAFSIQVSDVLRGFVESQYGLRAREQTSPEFLATLGAQPNFSAADQALLGTFLEKCDLIKFARIHATTEDSSALLTSAFAFVQGARA